MSDPVFDPSMVRIESMLGVQPSPTGEPSLAQVDNAMVQSIYDACTEYEYKQDAQGNWIRMEKKDVYPRIKRLLSSLSPLERNTRYDTDEARIALFDSRHRIRKLKATFRGKNDSFALEILDEISQLRFTVVMGDAYQGHKQLHIQKVSGAERKVTVERGGGGRSFMGRVTKR